MEKLKRDILEQVEESKRQEVKKLLDALELEAVEEYKKTKFKGRNKKYHILNETKEIIEKYINKELKTKETLEVLGVSKASFFRMLKEYKGHQVEELKETIKEQENQGKIKTSKEAISPTEYKKCKACGIEKPLSDFVKNGIKAGVQKYRPTCLICSKSLNTKLTK